MRSAAPVSFTLAAAALISTSDGTIATSFSEYLSISSFIVDAAALVFSATTADLAETMAGRSTLTSWIVSAWNSGDRTYSRYSPILSYWMRSTALALSSLTFSAGCSRACWNAQIIDSTRSELRTSCSLATYGSTYSLAEATYGAAY